MQSARSRPRTCVAAQARYALSTPPLNATMTESKSASSAKRGSLFVKVLFFVEGVLVVEIVLVLVEILFFLIFVLVVGDLDFIGACHHEVLAALRATERVTLFVISGLDLVEFALGAGRHTGSMRRKRRRQRVREMLHPQMDAAN